MWNFFKKIFASDPRQKYKMIGYAIQKVIWTDLDGLIEEIIYILLENDFGERKIEVACYGNSKQFNMEYDTDTYSKLKIWLHGGEIVPEIRFTPKEQFPTKPALHLTETKNNDNIVPFPTKD